MEGILTYLKTRSDSKWLMVDNLSKCSRKFTKKSDSLVESMDSNKNKAQPVRLTRILFLFYFW